MIKLIDATFKEFHSKLPFDSLIDVLKKTPVQGINWWNSNKFPFYLQTLHKNPWEILDTIEKNFQNVPIIIDIKGNQLNKRKAFSPEVVEIFFQQFRNKDNIYLKIYDPLNEVEKIKQFIQLANKYNLNIIGGVFLRPDLQSFPECHKEILNLYKESNITHISLIEPLGLLKESQITQIKTVIDDLNKTFQINLSFKHLRFEQSLLINEALLCGITEFDYDLVTNTFGYPSLEAIMHSMIFSKISTVENEYLYNLYHEFKFDLMQFSLSDTSKKEREFAFIQHSNLPIEVLDSINSLRYFTNIGFSLATVINEIKQVQIELGNPPLLEPFLTILVSQAIFRLQNSNKGIRTLDTIKYISGYWGVSQKAVDGEFKKYITPATTLKSKNKIFNLTNDTSENLSQTLKFYGLESLDEKIKLVFLLSPEEANFYYREYLPNPKSIDIRNKTNLAAIVKTIVQNHSTTAHDISLPTISQNGEEVQSDFRWRYLSRLFQMGKF